MNVRRYLLVGGLLVLGLSAEAADWPQWQGPNRTNLSEETGLLKRWPKEGPKLVWTYDDAGVGYSGPAIVGDRLYTMGARKDKEQVYCLEAKTGKPVWSTDIGNVFNNNWGDGPRGTPTVDGNVLFAIGGQGDVICVETAKGKKVWQKSMQKDFKGQMMSGWGYTESPLVDGDKLIVSPGGSGGTLAALNKKDGKVIWRSSGLTDKAAYSSVIAADVGGVRQYIQMTGVGFAGVSAKDGKMLWHHDKSNYRTAVIPTPIYSDGHVFATAGYGAGCDLVQLTSDGDKTTAKAVYDNKNMVNHHGGVVLVDGHLYGYSDGKGWVCMDFKTGKTKWEEKGKLGKGSITYADGRLYCYAESDGTLVLIEASPQGWKEEGRFKIPKQTTKRKPSGKIWTHPVVANGYLYLRDQDLIFCYDVRASAQAKGTP
jgi:outer membrane protein assembly factor BamB